MAKKSVCDEFEDKKIKSYTKLWFRYEPTNATEQPHIKFCSTEDASEKEKRDLLSEMSVLKHLDPHPHVICLYGCVTTEGEIQGMSVIINILTLWLSILSFSITSIPSINVWTWKSVSSFLVLAIYILEYFKRYCSLVLLLFTRSRHQSACHFMTKTACLPYLQKTLFDDDYLLSSSCIEFASTTIGSGWVRSVWWRPWIPEKEPRGSW